MIRPGAKTSSPYGVSHRFSRRVWSSRGGDSTTAGLAVYPISLVLLRVVAGDLAGSRPLWQLGGVLNEVAILGFLAVTAQVAHAARCSPAPRFG